MRRKLLFSIALLGCGLLAAPVAAAPLLTITYAVTGGSFSGLSSGSITGGTVVYVAPGAGVNTPFTCTSATCGSITALTLTGTGGSFTLLSPIQLTKATIATNTSTLLRTAATTFVSVNSAGGTYTASVFFGLANGGGPMSGSIAGGLPTEGTSISHIFTIGSEVRTFVPEPGTGLMVALGIGLLGLAGGTRAASRRR